MTGLESRFDWYAATFDSLDDDQVPGHLKIALRARISEGRGRFGYARNDVISRDDLVLAEVFSHSARAGEVHIVVTSDACDEVVPVIRRLFPEHRVARVDSACDFAADFDALDRLAVEFASARGLASMLITNSEGGATRYIGSPRSETRLRVYKKSEQLRAAHPESADEIADGIVRCELVGRPGKRKIKERVSGMHPDEVWGLSEWSRDFAQLILKFDAPRVATHFRRPVNWSRALHFLGSQYSPMIGRRIIEVGFDATRSEVLAALGLETEQPF